MMNRPTHKLRIVDCGLRITKIILSIHNRQSAIGNSSLLLASCFLLLIGGFLGCATTGGPQPKTMGQGPPPALQKIWEDPAQLFKEAKKFYEEANYSLALTAVDRILTTYPKTNVYADAKKLSEDIGNRMGTANFKIGVLLPLTGSFARFGESALDGISCAVGLFDPCGGAVTKAQIVVRDTKGDPNLVAQAIRDLVEKEQVSAIIGPLVSAEGGMAANLAQTLQVPMIVLAPQEGVTQGGDFIFQHSLLATSEVTGLVRQVGKLGLKKFIILYPKNRYGEQYHQLFVEEIKNSGEGKIIAEKSYAPDIPDFVGILDQLKKHPAVDKALSKDHAGKTGIFIPDSYKQVAQIAQGLDSLSIEGPKLIGTSRWYHPQLLAQTFASLEGALIDTPFYSEAKQEAAREFSDSFYKAYGNQPAWLEAFGFDAVRFVLNAFAVKGNNQPLDIRDALLTLQNFPAVVGPLSWNGERVSKWSLEFLTIRDGKFTTLGEP